MLASALQDFASISYPSAKQQASVSQAAMKAYADRSDFNQALPHALAWSTSAGKYDRGSALNHVAGLYDKVGRPEQAIAARQAAVAVLRKELDPVPVGVFGPLMKHKLQIPSALSRVRAGLKDIE